jgi:hypothetical protein
MSEVSEYRRGQAFAAGRKAATEGKPRTACNRQCGTIYYDDWMDGYEEAARQKGTADE